jgi:hypothetical protein
MLHHVVLLKTDDLVECIIPIISVNRISELGTTFLKEPHDVIPDDSILHRHRCENLKSYIMFDLATVLYNEPGICPS